MKRWLLSFVCLAVAVAACVQMFVLKYKVIEKEDELKAIHKQILEDSREIHMLEAEWAVKNDPERLYQLVTSQTNFKPITAPQVQSMTGLPVKIIPPPTKKPDFEEEGKSE